MYVKTSRGVASGPVSFAGQFDKETEVINSGNRRGANMGILNIYHPDIIEWIHSKTTEGKLANFNLSVGITDEFMNAVESDGYYTLRFNDTPLSVKTLESIIEKIKKNMGAAEVGAKPIPPSLKIDNGKIYDNYWNEEIGRIDENGKVQLKAGVIFDRIGKLAYNTADPGVVFLDRINEDNPLPLCRGHTGGNRKDENKRDGRHRKENACDHACLQHSCHRHGWNPTSCRIHQ